MTRNPRNHGFGDAPRVRGAPVVEGPTIAKCPNCGCGNTFAIAVEVENPSPLLRRPEGPCRAVGRYIGCPACPYASPMMTVFEPQKEAPDGREG